MTRVSIKDAPLSFLEAMALSLARDIDRGEEDKRGLLEEVMAEVPNAPEYAIENRKHR